MLAGSWRSCDICSVLAVLPPNTYMFKLNNTNSGKRCELCLKLTIKTLLRRHSGMRIFRGTTKFWFWNSTIFFDGKNILIVEKIGGTPLAPKTPSFFFHLRGLCTVCVFIVGFEQVNVCWVIFLTLNL